MPASSTCIVCSSPARKDQATALAQQTGLPLLEARDPRCELQLLFDQDRVRLFDATLDTAIDVDFVEGALAVLDVTAGLARDAFVLASLGCTVTLVEQSPILFALVADGIRRGLGDAGTADVLKNFTNLVNADAVLYMAHMDRETLPDVIYMDPMYPERKKSALVKKDMRILQRLLGKEQDAERLLKAALASAGKRVVVKRPLHADPVGDTRPDTSISSRKTRYDVYLANK